MNCIAMGKQFGNPIVGAAISWCSQAGTENNPVVEKIGKVSEIMSEISKELKNEAMISKNDKTAFNILTKKLLVIYHPDIGVGDVQFS